MKRHCGRLGYAIELEIATAAWHVAKMLYVVIGDGAVEQAAIPNREEKVSLNMYCRKS